MTTLLLPADGCPSCVIVARFVLVHPFAVIQPSPGSGSVDAYYCCPECGHAWRTGWAADAIGLPCPGCPACVAEEGAA